jgi:4-hydroxybenzoate polyprenyltransferase
MSRCRLVFGLPSRRAFSQNVMFTGSLVGQGTDVLSSPRLLAIKVYGSRSQQHVAYHASRKLLSTATESATKPSSGSNNINGPALEPYSPPKTGFLSLLPASWVPYAELTRIDKPTGAYYLFFPCLFSTLMAAPMVIPMASPASILGTSLLFLSGAVIMRGAGCTINDLWDRNLDPHVARTRLRPIARGAITPFQGVVFTGAQLLAGLGILLQFPLECFFYATPSLLFVALYPLATRSLSWA